MESSLKAELANLPKLHPNCCIYRVPRHLKMANEGAYTPLFVSIGPLHHYDEHLHPTEIHKLKYLKSFLDRSGQDLGVYSKLIRSHKAEILQYYADPMVGQIDPETLIRMVLVDSAFLIELFSRVHDDKLIKDDDQMFNAPRMVVEVSQDIRLEENQLPFFILWELYNTAFVHPTDYNHSQITPSFVEIACKFLCITKWINPNPQSIHTYKHILDLLRLNFLPSQLRVRQPNKNNYNVVYRSASTLHKAGVKFRVTEESNPPTSPLDIKFNLEEATMLIPRLVVQDDTEALFKNLAVFEQCHYFNNSYIIDYIAFMDFLIDTEEDVALLVKQGIIENWLGTYEGVVELFNRLNKHLKLRVDDFYYAGQCKQLDEYYNKPCNHHRAVLRQKYFNHPWAAVSVAYAVVLLVLTVVQAGTGLISALPSRK